MRRGKKCSPFTCLTASLATLAQELEEQLQQLVDAYQNEWETTIRSPEQVRRFKTFINMPADKQAQGGLWIFAFRMKRPLLFCE